MIEVDGVDEPALLQALIDQLAPFVALYPDWNQDGVLDADERAAPLAIGQP